MECQNRNLNSNPSPVFKLYKQKEKEESEKKKKKEKKKKSFQFHTSHFPTFLSIFTEKKRKKKKNRKSNKLSLSSLIAPSGLRNLGQEFRHLTIRNFGPFSFCKRIGPKRNATTQSSDLSPSLWRSSVICRKRSQPHFPTQSYYESSRFVSSIHIPSARLAFLQIFGLRTDPMANLLLSLLLFFWNVGQWIWMICENCHCQKTKKAFFFFVCVCVKIMVCLVAEKMEIKKKEAQFRCCLLNCLFYWTQKMHKLNSF